MTLLLLFGEPAAPPTDVFIEGLARIEQGVKPVTAAGLGGALQE